MDVLRKIRSSLHEYTRAQLDVYRSCIQIGNPPNKISLSLIKLLTKEIDRRDRTDRSLAKK
jgi:hypothetical protein